MRIVNNFKIKLIIVCLIMLLVSLIIPVRLLALPADMDPSQFDDAKYAEWSNQKIGSAGSAGNIIQKISGSVLGIVRIIALSIAIIMLICVAIKYMSSSPQLKAQLKMDVPTYLIGAVILFGTAGLLKLIEMFVTDNATGD